MAARLGINTGWNSAAGSVVGIGSSGSLLGLVLFNPPVLWLFAGATCSAGRCYSYICSVPGRLAGMVALTVERGRMRSPFEDDFHARRRLPLALAAAACMALLFVASGDRRAAAGRKWSTRRVTLSLAVCTSWTFYGSVSAPRRGLHFLRSISAHLGFCLVGCC
jgi:hypothetical protein